MLTYPRWILFLALSLPLAAQPAPTSKSARPPEVTPASFPGAETFVYREVAPLPVRLHVVKPHGWAKGDRRAALVFFYGGGWTHGTPEHSIGWAKWAASRGMVGIAPDYRTKQRWGTSPLEAVADGRAALRWVEDHAAELGIDPHRIVVGGNSAGGHLALWTAIAHTPPGSAADEAPTIKPAALILLSPVSDTSQATGYAPSRFGANADALSALHQLDAQMPPVLLFHGDADKIVPQRQSLELRDKLRAHGECEFINVPSGSHNFSGDLPGWREKTRDIVADFLTKHGYGKDEGRGTKG